MDGNLLKQAENGLQSRSSENGSVALWIEIAVILRIHTHMTSDFIHEEISYMKRFQSWTIMDYHELS